MTRLSRMQTIVSWIHDGDLEDALAILSCCLATIGVLYGHEVARRMGLAVTQASMELGRKGPKESPTTH